MGKNLDWRSIRVEIGTKVSEGDSVRGEKDPGMGCHIGLGNLREELEVKTVVDVVLSVVSGSVELLDGNSGSQIDGSRSNEGCLEDEAFLINRPDESLGCFGM